MAGTGPTGKHESVRRRRNKTSTRATLRAVPDLAIPELPDRDDGWHKQTVVWWRDTWRSPMAPEYDDSDLHGLFMLAHLVDTFWRAETSSARLEAAKEIRLARRDFGLTPMGRRSLQWEIEKVDEAQDKGKQRRARKKAPAKKTAKKADPRAALA